MASESCLHSRAFLLKLAPGTHSGTYLTIWYRINFSSTDDRVHVKGTHDLEKDRQEMRLEQQLRTCFARPCRLDGHKDRFRQLPYAHICECAEGREHNHSWSPSNYIHSLHDDMCCIADHEVSISFLITNYGYVVLLSNMVQIVHGGIQKQSQKFMWDFELDMLVLGYPVIEVTMKNTSMLLPARPVAHKCECPIPPHSDNLLVR